MVGEYVRQFPDVAFNIRIQFGAEYDYDPVLQELAVKVSTGKGDTVCGDEKICVVKVRGERVEEAQLDRPLPQL